jgi:hypothetical protein
MPPGPAPERPPWPPQAPPYGAPPYGAPPSAAHPAPGWQPHPGYPESSQGVLALVLGIVSVVSLPFLGPVAWWIGLSDKRAVDAGRRDPSGRGPAVAGYVLGIVGTAVLGFVLLFLASFFVLPLVMILIALPAVSATAPGEGDLRAQWLAAEPRDPGSGSGSEAGDAAGPDRCDGDLRDWLDDQFQVGMTEEETRAAVGEPDSVRTEADAEVWTWDLGVCSFVDYDTYRLEFEDGRLTDWTFVPG